MVFIAGSIPICLLFVLILEVCSYWPCYVQRSYLWECSGVCVPIGCVLYVQESVFPLVVFVLESVFLLAVYCMFRSLCSYWLCTVCSGVRVLIGCVCSGICVPIGCL